MMCDIQDVEINAETVPGAPEQTWQPRLSSVPAFDMEFNDGIPATDTWPEQDILEEWRSNDKTGNEIKLQKINYARIVGEHDIPLIGLQF